MNRTSTVLLVTGAFVLGCGMSAVRPLVVPSASAGGTPSARTGGTGPRWEYFCQTDIKRPWIPEDLAKLNNAGSEGWELVQQLAGRQGQNDDVYCFKRQLP